MKGKCDYDRVSSGMFTATVGIAILDLIAMFINGYYGNASCM
jgi:hypothetical protein